jgi:cytochrome b pre-mRNA-processing protein 3
VEEAESAMILRFFRPDLRRRVMDGLYARIAGASREPELYLRLGVPDTGEGRFESLTLHVVLVLRRLRGLPAPADDVAQDLVDLTFSQIDAALREMGIGDVAVPKRMKALARAFYGRAASYDAALDAGDMALLAAALARNVLGRDGASADGLALYARMAEEGLARLDLDAILSDTPLFAAEGSRTGRAP